MKETTVKMPAGAGLSANAQKVLESRYLLRTRTGKTMETADDLFHRVAAAVAAAEQQWGHAAEAEQEFYSILSDLLFLPNSPALMNAGTGNHQLSACFVLPIQDSMDSIFTTLKHTALIQQSGGGTGFNFSHLRPAGYPLQLSGGTASGPLSFLRIYDAATEHIKQGGKRRGANMGVLNIDHPDIEDFITAKKQKGILENFNISVGITDAFMQAVEVSGKWDLVHPRTREIIRQTDAKKLWDQIVHSAWKTGDPGLLFLDTINRANPTPALGNIEATNPCGEVPLLPYESCNLGSLNLSRFTRLNNGVHEIDWHRLEKAIATAIRFLDDMIEVNHYVIPEIREMAMGNRKAGLGVMGWAELLILLGLPYDSDKAVRLASQLMEFIQDKSREASAALARSRGVFLNWEKSTWYPGKPLRNATCTSIAPTGTISIIAGTSASIEPLFALAYERKHVLNDETLFFINPLFEEFLRSRRLWSEELIRQVMEQGTVAGCEEIPPDVKQLFKTATEISPERHLEHQLAFQQYTDNAVSKTINLPETATEKEVDEIYRKAWRHKAKGITVYRHRSKDRQVLYPGIRTMAGTCRICTE